MKMGVYSSGGYFEKSRKWNAYTGKDVMDFLLFDRLEMDGELRQVNCIAINAIPGEVYIPG
jgi:hypothetical protein